jgi:hypothetical protein
MATKKEPAEKVADRAATSARRAKRRASRAAKAAGKDLSLDDLRQYSPAVVGFVRGLILAALTAGTAAIADGLQSGHTGRALGVGVASSVGVAVFRFIEGVLDKAQGAPASARLLGGSPKS